MGNQIVNLTKGELPLTHTFSDGVYVREIFMKAGMIVVGHVHKTRHINIVSTGKALVWMNGEVKEVTAPYTFESEAGVRKVLYIIEDMFWSTVHVTNETNLDKLKDNLVDLKASENLSLNFDKITQELLEYNGGVE